MAIFSKKEEKKPKKSEKGEVLAAPKKENTGDAYKILVRPLTTEKTYVLNALGQYVFKVYPKANKISVRKAVEKVFDVHVIRVNIINVLGKKRNFGQTVGRTSNWKKAIVTLKKGEVIQGAEI